MKAENLSFLWQPFVPGTGANAQAVFNTETGAAINTILAAGAKVNGKAKAGQIFIQHPGLNSTDYPERFVIVNEVEYEAEYWKVEFICDSQKQNFIEAFFIPQKANRLLIEMTAHNKSSIKTEWSIALFYGPNSEAGALEMDASSLKLPDGNIFTCSSEPPLYSVPPLNGKEHFEGIGIDWGRREELKNYPSCLSLKFGEWIVPPGTSSVRRIIVGTASGNTTVSSAIQKISTFRNPLEKAVSHMQTQLKINRRYPAIKKKEGKPFPTFTPCASMEWEYCWDAGFIGLGLAAFDPELSKNCIRQYLPEEENSIWPNVVGAPVPTQILAAWELYQQTRDTLSLKALYPGFHRLWLAAAGYSDWLPLKHNLDQDKDGLILAPGAGSGLDDAPSQAWCRGYSVTWARQEHYWLKPLAVNNTGKCLQPESVNMTCFVILCAKILRQICSLIELKEPCEYSEFIVKAENALQEKCWNQETKHFHWVVEDSHEKIPYYDISGLCPLFSGSVTSAKQREILSDLLINMYLTPYGLTTVDPRADFYRKGYWCGAVWIPFQWTFWKWLIGQGDFEKADLIAKRFLAAYGKSYERQAAAYEKIDIESGMACGDLAFGGLAAPLVNLWSAYYKKGTLSLGFETVPLRVKINGNFSSGEILLSSNEIAEKTGAMIVLQPSSDYRFICNGSQEKIIKSDSDGVVNFTIESGKKTIRIEFEKLK